MTLNSSAQTQSDPARDDGRRNPSRGGENPSEAGAARAPQTSVPLVERDGSTRNALDLAPLLADFPAGDLDAPAARLVTGDDGRLKLQMRVELGLLQMETDGRPDGEPSRLDQLRDDLRRHRSTHRHDFGFTLDSAAADELEREGILHARRYLAWFCMEEWDRCAEDARRHLSILAMLERYADRSGCKQLWFAYATMMRARAEAASLVSRDKLVSAMRRISTGRKRLRQHFAQQERPDAYCDSPEARALDDVYRELRRLLPRSPVRQLQRRLRRAIDAEHYERAAQLRDQIASLGQAGGK